MPELPEVECLARAVHTVVEGKTLGKTKFLREDLRGPIPINDWRSILDGQVVSKVFRRSKYLILETQKGFGVIHLGMTGNLLLKDEREPTLPHTHAILEIKEKPRSKFLHYVDPRRFGRITCMEGHGLDDHPLFKNLGPEPLEENDLGQHLFTLSRGKKAQIKTFLMDANVVVGVGNIYASESLFRACISPIRQAKDLSLQEYKKLTKEIRKTLHLAIKSGGTSFRDYKAVDGNPGYFAVSLNVYGKTGDPCSNCQAPIKQVTQTGRSTFYCPECQS